MYTKCIMFNSCPVEKLSPIRSMDAIIQGLTESESSLKGLEKWHPRTGSESETFPDGC
jgi:hypothetical protein